MFRHVGALIKTPARYKKSQDALTAIRIRQIARDSLYGLTRDYPADVAKSIKVTTYKNMVLTVVAPAVVAADLHMRSGELVDEVNKRVGAKVLVSVKFRAG